MKEISNKILEFQYNSCKLKDLNRNKIVEFLG